jgi:hypothetical protein
MTDRLIVTRGYQLLRFRLFQDQLGECPPYDGVITTCICSPQIHCSSQSQCPNGE